MQKQLIKERLRIDLREKYRYTLLGNWQGKSLSATHVFCDSDDGLLILNFTGGPVIQSEDGGKTWGYYRGSRKWPSSDTGMFRQGDCLFALYNGRRYKWSVDGGMTWGPERLIPSAKDMHFSEIGDKNYFTAMMTLEGRIVVAGDYSLGKPDVDADVICVASTADWGASRVQSPIRSCRSFTESTGRIRRTGYRGDAEWVFMDGMPRSIRRALAVYLSRWRAYLE